MRITAVHQACADSSLIDWGGDWFDVWRYGGVEPSVTDLICCRSVIIKRWMCHTDGRSLLKNSGGGLPLKLPLFCPVSLVRQVSDYKLFSLMLLGN